MDGLFNYHANCDANCQFDTNRTKDHLIHHIKQGIITKITHADIGLVPSRSDFLDKNIRTAFATQIRMRKPIMFLPTSIVERDMWCDGAMKLRIQLFGVLPCGSKTCVVLDNIDVHVDIMVPDDISTRDYDNILRVMLLTKNLSFISIKDVMMFCPRGFQTTKRVYKRIMFSSLKDRKKVIEMFVVLNKDLKDNGKPQIDTAADDQSRSNFYFPKVAREFRFATADWNRFEKYEVMPNTTTNCEYMLRVDIRDFTRLHKTKRAELLKNPLIGPTIDRDPTIVGMWDIETHRTIQNGMVPTVADLDYTIFMMCSSYFHHWCDKSLFDVCVVDVETNARKGIKLVIECGNELNVLRVHLEVMGKMAPDITGAFNGGNFDWPLYREKLKRNNLLVTLKSKFSSIPIVTKGDYADTESSVMKWSFRNESIKIDAETKHNLDCVADFPGMLDTDVMPVFLKMYPRAEVRKSASLNYFLSRNGLESKEDMPYKKMFKIYERAVKLSGIKSCHCGDAQKCCSMCKEHVKEIDYVPLPDDMFDGLHNDLMKDGLELCCYCGKKQRNTRDMADVGYYCIIDCLRPQQLYVKRTVIADKRELSNMSFISLYDSFYRADGMKVRNLIGSYCHRYEMAFSNSKTNKTSAEKDHYPGAWVFPPVRGLNNKRPITGLDFQSLYPSLMMTYNYSKDMIVYTDKEAARLTALGYSLRPIEPFKYERGEKKGAVGNAELSAHGWTVRHNGIFNRKDTRTIEKYVKMITLIAGDITIKYPEDKGLTTEETTVIANIPSGCKVIRKVSYVPIYGRDKLPGERMGIISFIVKKLFDKRVPIKGDFVRLSKLKEHMEVDKVNVYVDPVTGSTYNLTDVKFDINKVDSKQKALKLLSNIMFGESGNYMSSIYELLVAAGITTAGQENIKKVAGFVTEKGFGVKYGDSVTADTPILCKYGEIIQYQTIDNIGSDWNAYGDKEQSTTDAYVWTERGWTKIHRVIRHKTDKQIYRINTPTGCVDVTSDHSLLNENAERVKPTDVHVGTALLHSNLPYASTYNKPIEAYTMGLFYSSGCDEYASQWSISNQNLNYLNRAKNELEIAYEINFKIIDTMESPKMYKLVATYASQCDVITLKYRKLFYLNNNSDYISIYNKHIPTQILNADLETKRLFIEGCADKMWTIITNKGKIGSAGLYHLLCELGYKSTIYVHSDKPDIYKISNSYNQIDYDSNKINQIIQLGQTTDYVYDLETENNHFSAGIGKLIVHNTDSLYLTCPDIVYEKPDREYADALHALAIEFEGTPNESIPQTDQSIAYKDRRTAIRIVYWTSMTEITMKVMNNMKELVSDFLLRDNGTISLNMAYEEVGMPTVLTGKKKYFLTPHIEKINFYPNEFFIKGIDIVKQGQSKIAKILGEEFIRESLSPENERDLIDIAEDKIRKYYNTKLDPSLVTLSKKYKPNKKNIPVLTFIARMCEMQKKYISDPMLQALYEPPEAGDKFEYIVVKKNQRYTLQGCMIETKIGDQMEFVRVYKASQNTPNPMEIDLDYYMSGAVNGLFARFIAYHDKFQPPVGMFDVNDKDQYHEMDLYCVNAASKYIIEICRGITGYDVKANAKLGRDYQKIYKSANKILRADVTKRYGSVGFVLHDVNIHADENTDAKTQSTRIVDQLKIFARNTVRPGFGIDYLKLNTLRGGPSVFRLNQIYNGERDLNISRMRVEICNRRELIIIEKLYAVLPKISRIVYKHERGVIALIDDMRKIKTDDDIEINDHDLNYLNAMSDDDHALLVSVHALTLDLIAIYNVRSNVLDIVSEIKQAKARMINDAMDPVINIREIAKIEATNALVLPDYDWA